MPKVLLTQKLVDTAVCPPHKQKEDYFDTRLPGLLLKVMPTGGKKYYLRYRNARGRVQERRLHCALRVTLTYARQQAKTALSNIERGHPPFVTRRRPSAAPSFDEFVRTRYLPHIRAGKRSWRVDESMLRLHVLPILGAYAIDRITRQDIVDLMSAHRQSHAPASTNRLISVLSVLFNLAIEWDVGAVTVNPVSAVKKLKENNQRGRYLTSCELHRLWCELERSGSPMLPYIIRMLILTGARKSEVAHARWHDIDFSRQQWRIKHNKSGTTRYVPLSDGVIALLHDVPKRVGSAYIFPNPETGRPYVNFYHAWNAVRKKAGLADVRIHDLRHTFASYLVNNGRSIYEVKQILGHANVTTTQRYAHLDQAVLLDATNTVASFVERVLTNTAATRSLF